MKALDKLVTRIQNRLETPPGPGEGQAPVDRYVSPHEFQRLEEYARSLGFGYVAAGPFVRSSYHAADYYAFIAEQREKGKETAHNGR
jgi:hypothetical protein